MTWVDTVGRWVIIGLGIAGGIALLLYVWDLLLYRIFSHLKMLNSLAEFVRHKQEFKQWLKARRDMYTLTEEEKRELQEIGAKNNETYSGDL